MKILKANTGAREQFIVSTHTYVKVWDYEKKHILVHMKLTSGESIWVWVDLTTGSISDISEMGYRSFEDAINKAVNNPYCTVYDFESFEELANHWDEVNYVDTITTTYKRGVDNV